MKGKESSNNFNTIHDSSCSYPLVLDNRTQFWVNSNKLVRQSNKFNFEGCQIEVPSPWNIPLFEELLQGYHDQEIIKFLRYGWPVELKHISQQASTDIPQNQRGARSNPVQISDYIEKELARGGIIGPFRHKILGENSRFSPLDAIPKKDTLDLRIIMNLSHPFGKDSINAANDKDNYLGKETNLVYPGLDELVKIISKKGRGSLLFKRDLSKYYRQVLMDPGIIHFLGFSVDGDIFHDVVLTMGLKIACYIAQRISNALMYIYGRLGYEGVNYIDDLGGADTVQRAYQAFYALGELLRNLGIWEAASKASPPAVILIFLGVLCNSETFTLEITKERLQEISELIERWLSWRTVSLRQEQSLAGKLNFVCSTVRAGRVFLSRIFAFLQSFAGQPGRKAITLEIRKDLFWWQTFLHQFNGVTMFPESRWKAPDTIVSTDSCLEGMGGWAEGEFFHCSFPARIRNNASLTINELECFAIVVAVKLWQSKLRNRNCLLYCDNESTCHVINKGKARHPFTQACLRELVWYCALNNAWLKVVHLKSSDNRISDLLSRWSLPGDAREAFYRETEGLRIKERKINKELLSFSHNW